MKSIQKILIMALKNYYNLIIPLLIFTFLNVNAQKKFNWVDISLVDTSEYGQYGVSHLAHSNYPPDHLFDARFNTCWVAASQKTEAPSLFLKLPDLDNVVINIFSGYGKSESLFFQNARPKKVMLKIFAAVNPEGYVSELGALYKAVPFPREKIILLADEYGIQSIPLAIPKKELTDFTMMISHAFDSEFKQAKAEVCMIMKMEITESYSGTKYDDICISEVFFNDRFIAMRPQKINPVSTVYLNKEENGLLLNDPVNKGVVIYTDPSSVLQIIEVSEDKKWAILISMPAELQGRAETTYLLAPLIPCHF